MLAFYGKQLRKKSGGWRGGGKTQKRKQRETWENMYAGEGVSDHQRGVNGAVPRSGKVMSLVL